MTVFLKIRPPCEKSKYFVWKNKILLNTWKGMIENSWRNVEDQFSFKIFCSRKFGEIFGHFKHKYFHFINRITNYWTIFFNFSHLRPIYGPFRWGHFCSNRMVAHCTYRKRLFWNKFFLSLWYFLSINYLKIMLTFNNADLTSIVPICKLKSSGLHNPY